MTARTSPRDAEIRKLKAIAVVCALGGLLIGINVGINLTRIAIAAPAVEAVAND